MSIFIGVYVVYYVADQSNVVALQSTSSQDYDLTDARNPFGMDFGS